jgi:SAM-dependent methyltransferase
MPPSPAEQSGPPARVRLIGRSITAIVARYPFLWRVLRTPLRRFFDRAASGWDERIQPDSPRHLAALAAAVEEIDAVPERILDLGTGTGAAALWIARRFPEAEVVGVDIAPAMIAAARGKVGPELAGRVRFEVADAAALPGLGEFDLVVQVSVPVFFDSVAEALRPGGHAVVVSSLGKRTPFHTPTPVLERGFGRRGLRPVASGQADPGLYFIARKPPA